MITLNKLSHLYLFIFVLSVHRGLIRIHLFNPISRYIYKCLLSVVVNLLRAYIQLLTNQTPLKTFSGCKWIHYWKQNKVFDVSITCGLSNNFLSMLFLENIFEYRIYSLIKKKKHVSHLYCFVIIVLRRLFRIELLPRYSCILFFFHITFH